MKTYQRILSITCWDLQKQESWLSFDYTKSRVQNPKSHSKNWNLNFQVESISKQQKTILYVKIDLIKKHLTNFGASGPSKQYLEIFSRKKRSNQPISWEKNSKKCRQHMNTKQNQVRTRAYVKILQSKIIF